MVVGGLQRYYGNEETKLLILNRFLKINNNTNTKKNLLVRHAKANGGPAVQMR